MSHDEFSKVEKNRNPGKSPGSLKTGGRQKGTPNKTSWNLKAALDESGFDPAVEIIDILKRTQNDDLKWQRLTWLFRYLFPQLKDVEAPTESPDPDADNVIAEQLSTDQLLSLVKRKE